MALIYDWFGSFVKISTSFKYTIIKICNLSAKILLTYAWKMPRVLDKLKSIT